MSEELKEKQDSGKENESMSFKARRVLADLSDFVVCVYMLCVIVILPLYSRLDYSSIGSDKVSFFTEVERIFCGVMPLLAACLLVATLLTERGKKNLRFPELSVTDWCAFGYGAILLISYFCSDYQSVALYGRTRWGMGVLAQMTFLGSYFAISRLWQKRKWIPFLLIPVSAVIFVLGYLNRFGIYPIPIENAETNPQFLSLIGNINWYCGWMVIPIFACVFFVWYREKMSWSVKILLYLYLFVGFAALVTNGSASGIVTLLGIFLLLFLLSTANTGNSTPGAGRSASDAVKIAVNAVNPTADPENLTADSENPTADVGNPTADSENLTADVGNLMAEAGKFSRYLQLVLTFAASCLFTMAVRVLAPDAITYEDGLGTLLTLSPIPVLLLAVCGALWFYVKGSSKRGRYPAIFFHKLSVGIGGAVCLCLCLYVILLVCNTLRPGSIGWLSDYAAFTFNTEWGSRRGATWTAGILVWLEQNPLKKLIGIGSDCMADYIMADAGETLDALVYGVWSRGTALTNAHCEPITVLVHSGILGLCAFGGMIGSAILRFLRVQGKKSGMEAAIVMACGGAVLAYSIHNLFSFQQIMNEPTMYLFLGMGEAWLGATASDEVSVSSNSSNSSNSSASSDSSDSNDSRDSSHSSASKKAAPAAMESPGKR